MPFAMVVFVATEPGGEEALCKKEKIIIIGNHCFSKLKLGTQLGKQAL